MGGGVAKRDPSRHQGDGLRPQNAAPSLLLSLGRLPRRLQLEAPLDHLIAAPLQSTPCKLHPLPARHSPSSLYTAVPRLPRQRAGRTSRLYLAKASSMDPHTPFSMTAKIRPGHPPHTALCPPLPQGNPATTEGHTDVGHHKGEGEQRGVGLEEVLVDRAAERSQHCALESRSCTWGQRQKPHPIFLGFQTVALIWDVQKPEIKEI